jgi:hypothetical protein
MESRSDSLALSGLADAGAPLGKGADLNYTQTIEYRWREVTEQLDNFYYVFRILYWLLL